MKFHLSLPLLSIAFIESTSPAAGAQVDLMPEGEDIYYFKPSETAAAATPPECNKEYESILDICEAGAYDLTEFCRLLAFVNYLDLSDSNKSFTIFAPTDEAVSRLFDDVLDSNGIGSTLMREIIQSNYIDGQVETRDLECNSKPNVVSSAGKDPPIKCKVDITGNTVPYIKGRGNARGYIPRFTDPQNPILTCNSNIYKIDEVVLLTNYV